MQKEEAMRLEISAHSHNESFARAVVGAFVARANPTLEEVADIKTAVSEAVTNSIVHGYKNDPSGLIEIRAILRENELEVQISDTGCGIENIEEAMEPFYTSLPEQERSGMGFAVMQAFMDDVQVESTPGEGTHIVMRKTLCTGR